MYLRTLSTPEFSKLKVILHRQDGLRVRTASLSRHLFLNSQAVPRSGCRVQVETARKS